ncbi:HNH endonuclease [Paenibacillus chitinolyticus]|uniref:HNH endonuclease n=1 Tax=Paenibacillus chitinolyticus TaxID=79263 RepID=UPI003D062659
MIGYDQIRVTSPYRMKRIDHVEITWKPGEHGRMKLRGIVDDADHVGAVLEASLKDEIQLFENGEDGEEPIFKGLITDVQAVFTQGVYTLEIEAMAGSYLLDVRRKRRSFQQADMDYPALIAAILADYPGHDVICEAGAGVPIGAPVIQYDETDWELLKRLASRFHTMLISDIWSVKPKFSFGIPKLKSRTLPSDTSYKAFKDLLAYQKAGGSGAGLHDTDFFGYEFESGIRYAIGEELRFKDKPMRVSEASGRMEAGQLKYTYRLSRLEGMYQPRLNNDKLTGISLEGKVLDVKGELVKLHLTIDKEQPKASAHWFAFAPPTGSAMYCMPKAGTDASLYLPDDSCGNAKVLDCVRKNGDSCAKTGNPSNRYFGTEHGSEVELTPTAVNVAGGSKEPLKLSFDDASGVTITSHKKLTLNAGEDISLYTPKRIVIKATSQLMAKKLAAQSGFAIEGEYHFLSENVLAEGRDQTAYPPYNDEPQKGTPPPPPPPPPEKKFSWGKLLGNVVAGLAVVAVVAVAAAFTVATLGAGAVIVGAVVAGAAIAGTAAVASMAVSDIMRGEVSDMSDYVMSGLRESVIGAVSGAVFGPLGVMGTLGGKMVLGGVTNAFESVIRQTMEGKGFSFETLATDALIGGLTAGVLDSRIVKGVAKHIGNGINKVAPWIKTGLEKVGQKFNHYVNKIAEAGNGIGAMFAQRQMAMAGGVRIPGVNVSKIETGQALPKTEVQKNYIAAMKEMEEKAAKEATGIKPVGGTPKATSSKPNKPPEKQLETKGMGENSERGGFGSDGQEVKYLSDFFEGADDGILRGIDPPTFYSVINESGGRIFVSTDKILQKHFSHILDEAKGNINILTGAHGTIDGTLVSEKKFLKDDLARWGDNKNVNIFDINNFPADKLSEIVRGKGTVICAWCYSERSKAVLKALGLID